MPPTTFAMPLDVRLIPLLGRLCRASTAFNIEAEAGTSGLRDVEFMADCLSVLEAMVGGMSV
jgi:hypothetical protein